MGISCRFPQQFKGESSDVHNKRLENSPRSALGHAKPLKIQEPCFFFFCMRLSFLESRFDVTVLQSDLGGPFRCTPTTGVEPPRFGMHAVEDAEPRFGSRALA